MKLKLTQSSLAGSGTELGKKIDSLFKAGVWVGNHVYSQAKGIGRMGDGRCPLLKLEHAETDDILVC